jgi:hypothetical protein
MSEDILQNISGDLHKYIYAAPIFDEISSACPSMALHFVYEFPGALHHGVPGEEGIHLHHLRHQKVCNAIGSFICILLTNATKIKVHP